MALHGLRTILYEQLFLTPPPTSHDFSGQTIIITGANTGLGLEAARSIVSLGAEKVIIAVRSTEKGEVAKKDIEASTKRNGVVEVWVLDLNSYDSVKAFAGKANTLKRLDGVIENAGVSTTKYVKAEENESTITTNVVSTLLLGLLLLPKLRASAMQYNIVPTLSIVTSEMHMLSDLPERKSTSIFDALNDEKSADMANRYPVSKLLEVFFVRELAERMSAGKKTSVVLNMVNPGWCHSQLMRETEGNLLLRAVKYLMCRRTDVGARCLVAGLEGGKKTHGQYMSVCAVSPPSPFVTSKEGLETQKRVWEELAVKLEAIQPGILENI